MKQQQRFKFVFFTAAALMFLFSASVLFVPFASQQDLLGNPLWIRLSGVWIWGTLILAYTLFYAANRLRRNTVKDRQSKKAVVRWGICRVFTNPLAKAADCAFVISLAGFIAILVFVPQSYAVYILLFAVLFSLQMHGVLNGENFRYIINLIRGDITNNQNSGGKRK